jgi:hypothetical protein
MVVTKGKALEEPVIVQLLVGANMNIQKVSDVKAYLMLDASQAKNITGKLLENDSESLDEFQRTAKFHLKFLNGSRISFANVKFAVQVQVAGQSVTLESLPSNPFVIITNESQYNKSDGMLLKIETFGAQSEASTSWPSLANKLHRYFLRATRQDLVKPQRFLSRQEILYMNQKFFGKSCKFSFTLFRRK